MKKLIDAATELNKEMGLEPAIPTDANEGVLKEGILEAAAYIEPDDAISKETLATIEELKGTKPKAKPMTKKPAAKKSAPAEKKALVKKSAAKKPAVTKEKAPAKEEKPVKEESVKKEAEKKSVAKKKMTRGDAVAKAIRELCPKGATMADIMERSNEIYVAAGGNSNPTATNVNSAILFSLSEFGVLKNNNGVYTLK